MNREVPQFYIKRQVERLAFPSSDQLATAARAELRALFGRYFEVPQPPAELFETLKNFAERGITRFDEVYFMPYLPNLQREDILWKRRGIVKPRDYFWQQIEYGGFPAYVAGLEEGWYIGDRRGKPMYANGQQRYGEDDYMEPLMVHLRATNRIKRYSRVSDYSRFGASAQEIEEVILPAFAEMSEALGFVRNRRYMEFNIRGNMAHPEWGQTNTWEWFGDSAFQGAHQLLGGLSGYDGGLGHVDNASVDSRMDDAGFSPVVAFPFRLR